MIFRPKNRRLVLPLNDRGPLNVMFLLSSMPVGGAEILLANLVRKMSCRFKPQIGCLKEPGELGDQLANEFEIHHGLISHKYDIGVVGRLRKLFRQQAIDAVITVGAGDKMFWGRIAAKWARVPVIAAALHSTGWPDGVGKLNRMLTPITDAFIAVAKTHQKYMVEQEGFPESKVRLIPNGVDTDRFQRNDYPREKIRNELGLGQNDWVCGIIAALRPEKNHRLFLESAALVLKNRPEAKFVIVGDGPERSAIETAISELHLTDSVILTGSRSDIPELLSGCDLFSLTSRNEASPVSIMEAMSMEIPVVAPNVGSISDTVGHGQTGFIFNGEDPQEIAGYWLKVLEDRNNAQEMGRRGREVILERSSLDRMVCGYEDLISEIYGSKALKQLPMGEMARPSQTPHSIGTD